MRYLFIVSTVKNSWHSPKGRINLHTANTVAAASPSVEIEKLPVPLLMEDSLFPSSFSGVSEPVDIICFGVSIGGVVF